MRQKHFHKMFQHPEQMVWELGRRMAPEYAQGFNFVSFLIFSTPSLFPIFQNGTLQGPWFCRKGDSWIWPQGLTFLILTKPGVKCQSSLAPKSWLQTSLLMELQSPKRIDAQVLTSKTVWLPKRFGAGLQISLLLEVPNRTRFDTQVLTSKTVWCWS